MPLQTCNRWRNVVTVNSDIYNVQKLTKPFM
uniref:Uncharacterized protein n=1 Tax=Arundo donax TaxID=35708 RepID=A0A0A9G535_ARUDO